MFLIIYCVFKKTLFVLTRYYNALMNYVNKENEASF